MIDWIKNLVFFKFKVNIKYFESSCSCFSQAAHQVIYLQTIDLFLKLSSVTAYTF